jgi:hypothetical protein
MQAQAQVAAEVRRGQLVHVRADGGARGDAGDCAADGERPDVGDGGLDPIMKKVEEEQLLPVHHVAEVAAEQVTDHGTEDPRADGVGPLELGVAA